MGPAALPLGMTSRLLALAMLVLVAMRTTPATAEPGDPVRLRLGTLAIDGSRYMADILALSQEIERRTRGRVQLDWVSGGQLGDDAAMADLIAHDKLDGGGLSETGLRALVPEMAAWGLPGLFGAYEQVDRATGALDPNVRELFAQRGLRFAMWADLGFANAFSTERIAPSSDALERAAAWLAMPLDGKLTAAITGGRARVWALPPLYMLVLNTPRARFATDLRYRYVIGGLVFSRAAWARIPPADQATILDACRTAEPHLRASWRKETVRGVAALEKSGVELRATSAAERAAFAEASAVLREARAKELGLSELLTAIAAARD